MDIGQPGRNGAIATLHVAVEPGTARGVAGILPMAVTGAAESRARQRLATISEAAVR